MAYEIPKERALKVSSSDIARIPRYRIDEAAQIDGEGIYNLWLDGLELDVALLPKPRRTQRLFVIYCGFVDQATMRPPVFQRWSWADIFPGHCLFVSDPILKQSPDIGLGWYIGREQDDVIGAVGMVARAVAAKLGVALEDIVFYGSSGGGFASLLSLTDIPQAAAIAVNPQTRLTAFQGHRLAALLEFGYGGISKDDFAQRFAGKNSIAAHAETLRASRILYVQCRDDPHHIDHHLSELIDGDPDGAFTTEYENLDVLMFDEPRGHGVGEPQALVPEIFARLDRLSARAKAS